MGSGAKLDVRSDLLRQAREARAFAARADRLAMGVADPNCLERLAAYAAEMDRKARDLEARAAASALSLRPADPPLSHSQQRSDAARSSATVSDTTARPTETNWDEMVSL